MSNEKYPSPKRVVEATAFVVRNLPPDFFLPAVMDYWQRNPRELQSILEQLAPMQNKEVLVSYWNQFYRGFGIAADFSEADIPTVAPGYRIIGITKGLTINRAIDVARSKFPVLVSCDDMDALVMKNDRTSEKAYFVAFRDRVEADEENKNKSANDLEKEGKPTITLLERIVMEIEYFQRTGSHLDIKNWTLCAGSRSADGCVPSVSWYGDDVGVNWDNPGSSYGSLRARSAELPL